MRRKADRTGRAAGLARALPRKVVEKSVESQKSVG
jgi:hypothetical protein